MKTVPILLASLALLACALYASASNGRAPPEAAGVRGVEAFATSANTASPEIEPFAAAANTAGADASVKGTQPMPRKPAVDDQMSYGQMSDIMQMDDTTRFTKIMLDQLEWRDGGTGEGRATWDAQAYYGGDYDKLWIKTEGKYVSKGQTGIHDATVEAFLDRVISKWWNLQAGGRQDFGTEQSRAWAALGIQGLAPQWFQTEATVYASDEGRTAARLKVQYDLLLTQRLVLQPFTEANFYGRSDPSHQIGSGLSDLEISLRLRYELRREFAPYAGIVWVRRFGSTAGLVRSTGEDVSDLELTAGLRVWF